MTQGVKLNTVGKVSSRNPCRAIRVLTTPDCGSLRLVLAQDSAARQVIQNCHGFKASSSRSLCRMLLLPVEAAVMPILAGRAPNFAARWLASCSLQEAERVLLKVLKQLLLIDISASLSSSLSPNQQCNPEVWLQLFDGRCYLISVSVHSTNARLSVFSQTPVSCTLDVLLDCMLLSMY